MKNITLLFLALLLLTCSNSDDDENRVEGTMEAIINGELVIFDFASGDGSFNIELDCVEPFHRIMGDMADGHLIVLNFYPSQGIGTYNPHGTYITRDGPYNDGVNNVGYNQDHFNWETQTHIEEIGTVTITSIANNRYKGTFYFTAVNENGRANEFGLPEEVIITDGKFEISKKFPRSCD